MWYRSEEYKATVPDFETARRIPTNTTGGNARSSSRLIRALNARISLSLTFGVSLCGAAQKFTTSASVSSISAKLCLR